MDSPTTDAHAHAHLPATAYLTALARAEAGPALDDPYARRFAERCPDSVRGITHHTAGPSVVVARTLLLDRLLTELLHEGSAEVCVNLGAGFDSRPYRLDWPTGCRAVEVDTAPVLDVKDALLPVGDAPVERLRCDVTDLATLTALLTPRTAGRRVTVLAEGLLTYLPPRQLQALARTLAPLGSSVSWLCDVVSVDSARLLTATARAAGAPLELHGLADLTPLEAAGWRCERLELLPSARPARGTSAVPDSVLLLRRASPLG
ncbi:class I SAM-dependent methyltransferase [Kitasatospora sp. McL0602]|uniref:class I SAM-dependent methyltransferase n=1 Tax=Kitasatospora sp. McL0602 TaxID=3439530 RepID=UPI003F895414